MGDLDNCCALRWHKYFCRLHFGPRGRAFAKVKKIGKDFNFFSLIICFWLGTFLDRMCMECIADGMMSNWKYSHTPFDTHIMTLFFLSFAALPQKNNLFGRFQALLWKVDRKGILAMCQSAATATPSLKPYYANSSICKTCL